MKNIFRKGLIIMGIYVAFTAYLLLAAERIERLDEEDSLEKVNVVLNYGE